MSTAPTIGHATDNTAVAASDAALHQGASRRAGAVIIFAPAMIATEAAVRRAGPRGRGLARYYKHGRGRDQQD